MEASKQSDDACFDHAAAAASCTGVECMQGEGATREQCSLQDTQYKKLYAQIAAGLALHWVLLQGLDGYGSTMHDWCMHMYLI